MLISHSRWLFCVTVAAAAWNRPHVAQALPEPFAISGFNYLGCYFEPQGYRMLEDKFWTDYGMSGCQDWCRKNGKKFAGMELDDQCFCGNEVKPKDPYAVQRDESKCSELCYMNSDEVCGGYGWMALYGQDGATFPTQTKLTLTPSQQPAPAPSSASKAAPSPPASQQQQQQAQESSSSRANEPATSSSQKTQQLGSTSSASSVDPGVSSTTSLTASSSDSAIMFSFSSSSTSSGSAAAGSSSASSSATDASHSTSASSGKSSTLAPARPLLPQTTSMAGAASTPRFKDRKQIPLSGVIITSSSASSQRDVVMTGVMIGISTFVVLLW